MRLSDKEAHILSVVEMDTRRSLEEIQKITGYKKHTIQYVLEKLKQKGIIKPLPFIDAYPLGYQDYAVYFSLAPENKIAKEKLVRRLVQSPQVSWLGELGGDYQYGMAIYAKNIGECVDFLNKLSAEFGHIFFEKSINIRASFHQFQRKYLSDKKLVEVESGFFGSAKEQIIIDSVDHKILSGMANESYSSLRDLSRQISVPLSTLTCHIEKLERLKIITAYTYAIDTAKIGMQMFNLLIYAKGINQQLSKDLFEFAKHHRHIIHFLQCIGEWDFEMGVDVERAEDIIEVTQEIYQQFGERILTVKTLPLFRYIKLSYYPFK